MLFNSLGFLVFFLVLLALHTLVRSWRARKTILLIGSYLFYAAWNPPFVILLWISTLVDWFAASRLFRESRKDRRVLFLLLSVSANLGLLGFFKYGGFLLENFIAVARLAGVAWTPASWDIVLPVGISFYTFQTMSYTLDVARGRRRPAESFLDFALYVTFFPQLVAGPIVRSTDFIPQCREPRRASRRQLGWGLFLMTLGLFQKIVLADALVSKAAEAVFSHRGLVQPFDAWIGVLAFSSQIFCDFAGYSTCAIGIAMCFGFLLPDNFRCPYAAVGLSDFWRRWHISLSTWLRDYLYIPLGGSRHGPNRMILSVMLTMLIGGLWHGASWTFVVWGGLHGIYLVIERWLRGRWGEVRWVKHGAGQAVMAAVTFWLVCLTWVFFRAEDFGTAWTLLGSLFGAHAQGDQVLATLDILYVLAVTGALLAAHWRLRETQLEPVVARMPWWLVGLMWTGMLGAIIMTQGGGDAFLYFQF